MSLHAALVLPTETPGNDTVDEVVADTINYAIIAAGVAIGALIGIVLALATIWAIRLLSREHRITRYFVRHARTPFIVFSALWGAHLGLGTVYDTAREMGVKWLASLDHAFVVAAIAAATWTLVSGAQTIEDITRKAASSHDASRASRMKTQAQMVRRIVQGALLILGAAAIAMTFPAARTAIASVLASAGVASIVATLAAQSMLANIFAGFQIAITDSLRVGDIIVVSGLDGPKVQGTVEEITLTYVVVHVWDGRRIVIPSSKFTTNEFENLTRRHTEMMATVELYLDYRAPITLLRAHVDDILAETDLWDGGDANVQVTASNGTTMTVRIVVSAQNSGQAWDLSCLLRERLITWIVREVPYALPRTRYQQLDVDHVSHDLAAEEIADLAQELAGIRGVALGSGTARTEGETPRDGLPTSVLPASGEDRIKRAHSTDDPHHEARVNAAKQRAREETVARRSILTGRPALSEDTEDKPAGTDPTIPLQTSPTTTGDRLYSGSPEAERRSALFSGTPHKENPDDDQA